MSLAEYIIIGLLVINVLVQGYLLKEHVVGEHRDITVKVRKENTWQMPE